MLIRHLLVGLTCAIFSLKLAAQTPPTDNKLRILYAADLPEVNSVQTGGFAQISSLLNTLRQQPEPVLFLLGGGCIGPSALAGFDHGAHIIDILNNLEPDAMAVAKGDFSYYENELTLRAYEAAFPFVISNMYRKETGLNIDEVVPHVMISRDDIDIGVIATIHDSVLEEYLLQNVEVSLPLQATERAAEQLRQQGADLVILLHQHPFNFIPQMLEEGTIDLALSTQKVNSAVPVEQASNDMVVIKRAGRVAVIDVNLSGDSEQADQFSLQNYDLTELPADPVVAEQISGYTQRLNKLLGNEVATLPQSVDTRRQTIRSGQNQFGNLIADAMREIAHTDIALINSGNIRGDRLYPAGYQMTRKDIANELPYRSRIVLLSVTGQQVYAALENGFSMLEDSKGRFPNISGIEVEYSNKADVGQRVRMIKINGKPLDVSGKYKLATTKYIASGGDGYDMFINTKPIDTGSMDSPLIADILIDHLTSNQNISFAKDNRMNLSDE